MNKISAHECSIRDVSKEEQRDFLLSNHTQGYARAIKCYGLYYNDELVALMSFGKPRFNKNYQWEIIRECTKRDYVVRGATSKLWRHFIKQNSVRSCICYSYPHDGEFTPHYINYCEFTNLKRSKPERKIYFEGIWNGELKRIDKSLLEKQGVDRLLRGDFGHDRTNEQILLDLGFEKRYEDGYSPQIDSYFPFGVLYRIDDLTDGTFYIGMTEREEEWNNGYMGSGEIWKAHCESHPDHDYVRTVLKSDFKSPRELRDAEYNEIKKYVDNNDKINHSTGCLNSVLRTQGDPYVSLKKCPECGLTHAHHTKECSHYIEPRKCPECGSSHGKHKRSCSKYEDPGRCPECGYSLQSHRHAKTCSHYKKASTSDSICPECGGKAGQHRKGCSKYIQPSACPECGCIKGHKKTCSHRTESEPCPECGSRFGHKSSCSHGDSSRCPHCGNLVKSRTHKPWCVDYKYKQGNRYRPEDILYVCAECKGINGEHSTKCSHYIHKTPEPCSECGVLGGKHLKTCSHYHVREPIIVCPECGGKRGSHRNFCSKYHHKPRRRCEECGAPLNAHKKTCSHYKAPKPCPHCGKTHGHHTTDCPDYKSRKR